MGISPLERKSFIYKDFELFLGENNLMVVYIHDALYGNDKDNLDQFTDSNDTFEKDGKL